MSSQQEGTLTPSLAEEDDPTTLQEQMAFYDDVIAAIHRLPYPQECISKAALQMKIEDLARKELKKIGDIIEQKATWIPAYQHRDVLLRDSWTGVPDTPDAFFSRHANTKARLILRLVAKPVLSLVKSLLSTPGLVLLLISHFEEFDLHNRIEEFIVHWEKTKEFEALGVAQRKEKKRLQESTTGRKASKRQLTTESWGQEGFRQPQIPNRVHVEHTRDSPQLGGLPTIASLHPKLPDFQYHQSQPSTMQQIIAQTDHFTQQHAIHARPAPQPSNYHAQQSRLDQTEERGLQMQQQQQQRGPQMQQQQQGLDEDFGEDLWGGEFLEQYLDLNPQ